MAANSKDLSSGVLDFEQLVGKTPEESVRAIYAHVEQHSYEARQWYWDKLGPKRVASTIARIVAFVLAGAGAVVPVYASIWTTTVESRLTITQAGVVAVALGGLVAFADRVFGWSSGWMRYMSTALSMERIRQEFLLEWAAYSLAKTSSPPTKENLVDLFEIGRRYHESINARVREETDGWVAEFASSMGALEEVLRKQRESSEKALQQVVTDQQKTIAGALQLVLRRSEGATGPVTITLDDKPVTTVGGNSWALSDVAPGVRIVGARTDVAGEAREVRKAVIMPAGGVANVEIDI